MSVSMEGKSQQQLFLIMKDKNFRYCLYRVETEKSEEEDSSRQKFGEPLFVMDKSKFPDSMSFKVVGTRLFMIGGIRRREGDNPCSKSNQVFIYDIVSSTLELGPPLNSSKPSPILLSFGYCSRIYAMSRMIHCNCKNNALDPEPRFEVLDTDHLDCGWSPLPVPEFPTPKSRAQYIYKVRATAAVYVGNSRKEVIFISVPDTGTYAFDVEKGVWHCVSGEMLPFSGNACTFPDANSLCFGYSLKSKKLSTFRFHYYDAPESNFGFHVDEFEVHNPTLLSSPLPPVLYHCGSSLTVVGCHGKVFIIKGGVDKIIDGLYNYIGDRYVKVIAFELSGLKLDSNEGWSLKRCEKRRKMMMGQQADDETIMELILTRKWREAFFGGPMCDLREHVTAAFVM